MKIYELIYYYITISLFCKNRKEKKGELRNPLETYNNSHFPHIENYSFTLNGHSQKIITFGTEIDSVSQ